MVASSGVSDLLALATIRRILLELGHALQPEAPGTLVGPLELWMRVPRAQLDGLSPMQVLAGTGGEERVRACIAELVRAVSTTTDDPPHGSDSRDGKDRSSP